MVRVCGGYSAPGSYPINGYKPEESVMRVMIDQEQQALSLYTDGASRGNPGPAAIAYAIYDQTGQLIEKGAKCIGRHTNNEAEYEAVLWGLQKVTERRCTSVKAFSDSELVVRQVNGVYKTKDRRMEIFANRVRKYKDIFGAFELASVPRENPRTELVDGLVNEALDRGCVD
jgi:ribonuclease HI